MLASVIPRLIINQQGWIAATDGFAKLHMLSASPGKNASVQLKQLCLGVIKLYGEFQLVMGVPLCRWMVFVNGKIPMKNG